MIGVILAPATSVQTVVGLSDFHEYRSCFLKELLENLHKSFELIAEKSFDMTKCENNPSCSEKIVFQFRQQDLYLFDFFYIFLKTEACEKKSLSIIINSYLC